VSLTVAAAFHPRFPGDLAIAEQVQAIAASWLDSVMEAVTVFASTPVAIASLLTLAVGLSLARRFLDAAIVLFGGIGFDSLIQGVKWAVARPRPPDDLVRILEIGSSGSFPSGHTYHAVLLSGLLLVLLVFRVHHTWLRRALTTLLVALALLIIISRVYLGAHWPSDVLGGIALGVPSVTFLFGVRQQLLLRRVASDQPSPS
jgi:undecaprenyl-diphosphatase